MGEWFEVREPKIWVSRLLSDLFPVAMNTVTDGDNVAFIIASECSGKLALPKDAPKFMAPKRGKAAKIIKHDAFRIYGPVNIISPAMRAVLLQFDIGDTQMSEVPILEKDRETHSGMPNYFTLNVNPSKDTLIVELSDAVKKPITPGHDKPAPGIRWKPTNTHDILAVKATAAGGADLWHDPDLQNRFFLSDRLKQAIVAAGLKTKALNLYPARVFARG